MTEPAAPPPQPSTTEERECLLSAIHEAERAAARLDGLQLQLLRLEGHAAPAPEWNADHTFGERSIGRFTIEVTRLPGNAPRPWRARACHGLLNIGQNTARGEDWPEAWGAAWRELEEAVRPVVDMTASLRSRVNPEWSAAARQNSQHLAQLLAALDAVPPGGRDAWDFAIAEVHRLRGNAAGALEFAGEATAARDELAAKLAVKQGISTSEVARSAANVAALVWCRSAFDRIAAHSVSLASLAICRQGYYVAKNAYMHGMGVDESLSQVESEIAGPPSPPKSEEPTP